MIVRTTDEIWPAAVIGQWTLLKGGTYRNEIEQ